MNDMRPGNPTRDERKGHDMIGTAISAITSITIDVSITVTVDEGAILRMFIDDAYANPQLIDRECEVDACDTAYGMIAPVINNTLSSRAGFNWGRLTSHKSGENTYTAVSSVECYTDPDETGDDSIDRIIGIFHTCFDGDDTIEFTVSDVERTGV